MLPPECPGYPEPLDLVIRDQYSVACAAVQRRQKRKVQSLPTTKGPSTSPSPPLPEDRESHSLCFFMSCYSGDSPDPLLDREVIKIVSQQKGSHEMHAPALDSLAALSSLLFNKLQCQESQPDNIFVRTRYGNAIAATRHALQDPARVPPEAALVSICLLGMFEAACGSFEGRISSGHHFRGAEALLAQWRGDLEGVLFQKVVAGIRSHLAFRAAESATSIDLSTKLWQYAGFKATSPSDQLDFLVADVANILFMGSHVTDHTGGLISEPAGKDLISRIKEMDRRLQDWVRLLPQEWTYTFVKVTDLPGSIQRLGVYGQVCHIYQDVRCCATWNYWRNTRLKLLALFARSAEGAEQETAIETIQSAADGICASIPFCLGDRDRAAPVYAVKVAYPSCHHREITDAYLREAFAFGGWYLFAPMKQVIAVSQYLRSGQAIFVGQQLRRLARIYGVNPTE